MEASILRGGTVISIHALLAESDPQYLGCPPETPEISIHALLAESDAYAEAGKDAAEVFQSTLSLRRATVLLGQPEGL